MQCLYVAGIVTECPVRRGAHLWEVSSSGSLTVHEPRNPLVLMTQSASHSQFFIASYIHKLCHHILINSYQSDWMFLCLFRVILKPLKHQMFLN